MAGTSLRVKELLKERSWTTKILAEKTGMSESYLTHIKNGTRRWNEDALKKIAEAFSLDPIDLFVHRKRRSIEQVEEEQRLIRQALTSVELRVSKVPVMGDIPSYPSAHNNQITQVTTGYKEVFVPIVNVADEAVFAYYLENNNLAPRFSRGDYLIISPEAIPASGDIIAVEYKTDRICKTIAQVTFMSEFIVLESVNHRHAPVALVKGKDQFRVIGKVIFIYQKLG